jgi:tryptophan-rich sensory protein
MPEARRIRGVWTALYLLIGIAAALVWRESLDARFTFALALNLVLNAGWWWIFFGLRSPAAAFAELVVLEVTCVALVPLAARISTASAALLLPYALWNAFALLLNGTIAWRLRRRRSRPGP